MSSEPYASEQFLRELLCEGEAEGSSCGPDYNGAPMVCARALNCAYEPNPACVICLDGAVVKLTGPAAAPPPHGRALRRLPETSDQQQLRLSSEERLTSSTRVLGGLLIVTIVVASVLIVMRVRKRAPPRALHSVLAIAIIGSGAVAWKHQTAERDHHDVVAQIERDRLVMMRSAQAKITMPSHWPDEERMMEQLKRLADERHKDWQARAIDAGLEANEH